jgi:glycosyltransferase involved in cell wall biosynthesis
MISVVEVRIPTYKRPKMLYRAICSLLDQTYSDFEAIVFDDSLEGEAEAVVRSFADRRLSYKRNKKNLGCAASLDNAFTTGSFGDASFACVLEDDNVFLPTYLEENIRCMENAAVSIVQRNQESWFQANNGDYYPLHSTTLESKWQEGLVSPLRLAAMLFCHVPISNGGLFWRCDAISDLVVGESVKDGALQEFARTSQIVENVYCAMKPLAKYTVMDTTTRGAVPYRQSAVFMQQLRRHLYNRYGKELLEEAIRYNDFNINANAKKWIAQDLGILTEVRLLPYWLKGRWIAALGRNPYPEYHSTNVY